MMLTRRPLGGCGGGHLSRSHRQRRGRPSVVQQVRSSSHANLADTPKLNVLPTTRNTHTHTREPTLHCVVETNQEGAHKAQLTYGNARFAPPGWHITEIDETLVMNWNRGLWHQLVRRVHPGRAPRLAGRVHRLDHVRNTTPHHTTPSRPWFISARGFSASHT